MATPGQDPIERRLAAILAADVAGYSRLTGLDEEGTHARLQDHLRSLVDPKIAEHRGRVVKNTGDGRPSGTRTCRRKGGSSFVSASTLATS